MPISDQELDKLESLVDHFRSRKERATTRLASRPGKDWCFGLIGLEIPESRMVVLPNALIQRVEESPGEVELAGALKSPHLLSAVARYSPAIRHELLIDSKFGGSDGSGPFTLSWWIVSALRIRTCCDILVPVALDTPWATVAGCANHSVTAAMIEDHPKAFQIDTPQLIRVEDITWVSTNLAAFAKLLEIPNFRLAVDSVTTHQHHASLRMTVASLWVGIEAMFQVTQELRFRISALLAAALEPPGLTRHQLYTQAKKLYDFRSKSVHGSAAKDAEMIEHIRTTRHLLCRLLQVTVEHGRCFTTEELEQKLFSQA